MHTCTHRHTHNMHAYINQKNSYAARFKADGCRLPMSSGITFKRNAARCTNDLCPTAVLVVGGRRCWSCQVHALAVALPGIGKIDKQRGEMLRLAQDTNSWAIIAVCESHIWPGVCRPSSSRTRDTLRDTVRDTSCLSRQGESTHA